MCFLLFLSPVGTRGEQVPPAGCPPLSEQGSAEQVLVYVAKAQDKLGLVCVRVINGLSEAIHYGPPLGRLQHWEEGPGGKTGQFRGYKDVDTLPDGSRFRVPSVLRRLAAGKYNDELLPYSRMPAPAGRYRVRARYKVVRQEEWSEHEVCSEEFSLP